MAEKLVNKSITSAGNYVWDANYTENTHSKPADNLQQYRDCRISNDGPGSAVITVDYGEGYQTLETLAADDYNIYLVPGAHGIKVTASGGDCSVSFQSYTKLS